MKIIETYRLRENALSTWRDSLSDQQQKCLAKAKYQKDDEDRFFPGNKNRDHFCLKIKKLKNLKDEEDIKFSVESSYFIGVQWLVKDELPIFVYPKTDSKNNGKELDYFKILFEALNNVESIDHIKQLVHIDFEQPPILIEQQQDLVTPLLVVQYLHLLKEIVRKGLKRSYYKVSRNLNTKVKGKILVSQTIKKNHARQKMLKSFCSYEEFGFDHKENRLLKKAFLFGIKYLHQLKHTNTDLTQVEDIIRYIRPAFYSVGTEVDIRELKSFKPNPLFKEYNDALSLAMSILKRFGYNITNTENTKLETPPFWIDMSKLFELYVLKLLKERYHAKVLYQLTTYGNALDYLITEDKREMVVDAKYKLKYIELNGKKHEDIRQVSGYARLKKVYNYLKNKEYPDSIDCLIIYADQENGEANLMNDDKMKSKPIDAYHGVYKIGVKLPMISKQDK